MLLQEYLRKSRALKSPIEYGVMATISSRFFPARALLMKIRQPCQKLIELLQQKVKRVQGGDRKLMTKYTRVFSMS